MSASSDDVLNMRHRTGLFVVFTLTLLLTHIRLILLNQSTVESLNAQYMKEREKSVLARMFAWYQFRYVIYSGVITTRGPDDIGTAPSARRGDSGTGSGETSTLRATSGGLAAIERTGRQSWVAASGGGSVRLRLAASLQN